MFVKTIPVGFIANILNAIYPRVPFDGQEVEREQPCMVCGNTTGTRIARTAFWDLLECSVVRCSKCNHIQLDPVLSSGATETGCQAYFAFQSMHETRKSELRNQIRNYRRGILFAYGLKRQGFNPREILEFGPGSGYFSKGIRHIFPFSSVTVADIVEEVLDFNQKVHHFTCIHGSPGSIASQADKKFDLIIARDILEHVPDIRSMVREVTDLLSPGGLFHFLTPNGFEDVWDHAVLWKLKQQSAGLMINHVSYFDGRGLKTLLGEYNLDPVRYYTYQIKSVIKYGKGWRMTERDASPHATYPSAIEMIRKYTEKKTEKTNEAIQVSLPWYLRTKQTWITVFICWYHHRVALKLPSELNLGHEIFGLFIFHPQPGR